MNKDKEDHQIRTKPSIHFGDAGFCDAGDIAV